jgi:hypothetical protein
MCDRLPLRGLWLRRSWIGFVLVGYLLAFALAPGSAAFRCVFGFGPSAPSMTFQGFFKE